MSRFISVLLLIILGSIYAINRPVYKIVLTQKGFAQFLQYDVETPPLREFTFCTWIRLYDLLNDQSIFTYVANGNNRVVRLWLDSGGRHLKINIKGRVTSTVRVNVVKDVWRHVCLSYQSDFGAWALYVDARLVSCEAAHSLQGFVLPSGGSVIIGYGTADNGAPNGLEGEIFGANMILVSSIERNYTTKLDPYYEQKEFKRNKLKKDTNDVNYIVLSDLITDEIHNNYEKAYSTPSTNTTKSYISIKTPNSIIEHSVGASVKRPPEHEIFDFNTADFQTTDSHKVDLWNVDSDRTTKGNMKEQITGGRTIKLLDAGSIGTPVISEFETPPPPSLYFDTTLYAKEKPASEPIYTVVDKNNDDNKLFHKTTAPQLPDYEIPPPKTKSNKVYGQWTSSKFAGTVLNYLKNNNFKIRESTKKVPPTIPLHKHSDAYPYASDLMIAKLRPPSQFKRRNVVEKRYGFIKRVPQINVQILEDDLRSNIIKMHAEIQPKRIEITNRGVTKKTKHRFYRNINYDSDESTDSAEDGGDSLAVTQPIIEQSNHRYHDKNLIHTPKASVLPFKKSMEYLDNNKESQNVERNKDINYKSFSGKNKWHNVKTYSNDYTPHKINIELEETEGERKRQHPAVRLNYVHEKRKKSNHQDPSLLKARELAMEVSHQSTLQADSVSILKYNHGYLSTQDNGVTKKNPMLIPIKPKRDMNPSSFNKPVKIGNALNERNVVGDNEDQKRKSFEGGNDNIPDINRYRSDIDQRDEKVPPSLGPRECKNVELCDRVLYVQQDESIDMTHIVSPMRVKNIAIEFVTQNYKKCSLTDSPFQKSKFLLINWSKTPVRLFGGAYPKKTTDLCGFF